MSLCTFKKYVFIITNIVHISINQVISGIQDQEYTVTDVIEGKEYFFRVTACNKCGPGEPAYIDDPINVSSPASKWLAAISSNRSDDNYSIDHFRF